MKYVNTYALDKNNNYRVINDPEEFIKNNVEWSDSDDKISENVNDDSEASDKIFDLNSNYPEAKIPKKSSKILKPWFTPGIKINKGFSVSSSNKKVD